MHSFQIHCTTVLQVIDAQAPAALLSDSFTDVDFDTVKSILERESLNCKETDVFHAARRCENQL